MLGRNKTHHGRGACHADGGGGDAEYGEPPAYEGQLLRVICYVEGDFIGARRVEGGGFR